MVKMTMEENGSNRSDPTTTVSVGLNSTQMGTTKRLEVETVIL